MKLLESEIPIRQRFDSIKLRVIKQCLKTSHTCPDEAYLDEQNEFVFDLLPKFYKNMDSQASIDLFNNVLVSNLVEPAQYDTFLRAALQIFEENCKNEGSEDPMF